MTILNRRLQPDRALVLSDTLTTSVDTVGIPILPHIGAIVAANGCTLSIQAVIGSRGAACFAVDDADAFAGDGTATVLGSPERLPVSASGAERTRRYRERIDRGVQLVTIPVSATTIYTLARLGFLPNVDNVDVSKLHAAIGRLIQWAEKQQR